MSLDFVSAAPMKSFFVHMLTRDILLDEAILDLLDNCVDGIQRTASKKTLNSPTPYKGYYAKINISAQSFSIEDNCGGIPEDKLRYAFRMGKHKDDIDIGVKTVGVYGIGMKRAIFKIGNECSIFTSHDKNAWEIPITENWMNNETTWDLSVQTIKYDKNRANSTCIEIHKLKSETRQLFGSEGFLHEFRVSVARHYSGIISKGFKVIINDSPVKPAIIKLAFSETGDKHKIEPYIYQASYEGVDVFLAIGFTGGIPSSDEANDENENYKGKYSSENAGWTIVCNDRVVAYCDKTRLTGWGIAGAPQYHTQFIAISGIVEFSSEDPRLLPTTTTKRGINANSEIYSAVRDRMVEGLKIFTRYTNEWKSKEHIEIARSSIKDDKMLDLSEIKDKTSSLKLNSSRTGIKGSFYKPVLPKPIPKDNLRRIQFDRTADDIDKVAEYLFGTIDVSPTKVGEQCFNTILEESRS